MTAPNPLLGRRALVTGASRRIGRAIALRLADAGADVAVHHGRDAAGAATTAREVEARGRRAVLLGGDLTDERACAALVEDVENRLGPVDLLVNNAAIFRRAPLEAMDARGFDEAMAVNARAPYLLSLHAGRRMKARGSGAIVNLACASGIKAWKSYVAYSASKAAIVSLTHGFALALAPEVRVNAVAPGPILPAEGATPEQDRRALEATLLKRWGAPADVAAAVLFLATAPWLTGVVLAVDGGRTT